MSLLSRETQSLSIVVGLTPADRKRFFPGGVLVKDFAVVEMDPTGTSSDEWCARLAEMEARVLISAWGTPSLSGFEVLGRPCPLAYVSHITGSVRPVVPRALLADWLLVTNWGGRAAPMVAEHALLLVLACLRSATRWRDTTPKGATAAEHLMTRTLHRRRVGLHGFGAVARELVALLRPFEVRLAAYSAGVAPAHMRNLGVEPAESLEDLFAGCEVLVECEALTAATRGVVTRAMFERLPPDAVFVNVGRGAVVDEAALRGLAECGRLRVGLDVLADEPLTPDSPWWRTPGVLLSPHIAGPTHDRFPALGEAALDNVRRFVAGEPVERVVTLEAYDRGT